MSCFGECNISFLIDSQGQINSKLNEKKKRMITYNNINMKTNCVEEFEVPEDLSLSLLSHSRKRFSKFPHKTFIIISRDIIGLVHFVF